MPESDKSRPVAPIHIGMLLIDGFAMMSYAALIEPFRAANRLAGAPLYAWTHVTLGGPAALASNGASLLADRTIAAPFACDRLFVFAAGDPAAFRDEACLAWLRQMARTGASIGGVSGGPYLLARAGLLAGHRATIHWEHMPMLAAEFPGLALETGLYVIDRQRMTCAGGTAGLDLAVALIERDFGAALARQVAEWFIRSEARAGGIAQRASPAERHGTRHPALLRALAAMDAAIEEPLPRAALARAAGLSLRQLERLCARELGRTLAETYIALRLERAAELLRATGLSVTDVALACGFRSASHFSRRFTARFGFNPRRRET